MVDQFHNVCSRRKLRVKAGKSKVIVFERREVEVVDFRKQYGVGVLVNERCEIVLEERMEVVKELKYLGTVLSKYGEMEGEVRERAVKGRTAIISLARVMKGRSVSIEVRRGLRNSIHLPTLTYGSEMWMWNGAQQSRVHAVDMSYLRGACGVTRWDGESNKSVYERCGMGSRANGVNCGVVEWVKRNRLRWLGHIERRPPGRWRDRVKEYMFERGATR